MIDEELKAILACPACKGELLFEETRIICPACRKAYPIRDGNRVLPMVGAGMFFSRLCDAVDAARHSVWVTVAFWDRKFLFPEGRGGLPQDMVTAYGWLSLALENGVKTEARDMVAKQLDPGRLAAAKLAADSLRARVRAAKP